MIEARARKDAGSRLALLGWRTAVKRLLKDPSPTRSSATPTWPFARGVVDCAVCMLLANLASMIVESHVSLASELVLTASALMSGALLCAFGSPLRWISWAQKCGPRAAGGPYGLSLGNRQARLGSSDRADANSRRPGSPVGVRKPQYLEVSEHFEQQVEEFAAEVAPTAKSESIVRELEGAARTAVKKLFPEAEIRALSSGNPTRTSDFDVAVPELEIVVTIGPLELARHLETMLTEGKMNVLCSDGRKLQKSGLRVCCDALVATGQFRLWRSFYRGSEPKATLVATVSDDVRPSSPTDPDQEEHGGRCIAVDIFVNCSAPLRNSTLLGTCAQLEPRANGLYFLVKRWAKERGLCRAVRGHLTPYAWTMLVAYFLQVGADEGQLLPALEAAKTPSGPSVRPRNAFSSTRVARGPTVKRRRLGSLFAQFIQFYAQEVDWRSGEVASIRTGQRMPAKLAGPLQTTSADGGARTLPVIEDPFQPAQNLLSAVPAEDIAHFHDEFARARNLLAAGAPLSDVMEPWVERPAGASSDDTPDVDLDVEATVGRLGRQCSEPRTGGNVANSSRIAHNSRGGAAAAVDVSLVPRGASQSPKQQGKVIVRAAKRSIDKDAALRRRSTL